MENAAIELLIEATIRNLETNGNNLDSARKSNDGAISGLKDLARVIRSSPTAPGNSALTDGLAGLMQGSFPGLPLGGGLSEGLETNTKAANAMAIATEQQENSVSGNHQKAHPWTEKHVSQLVAKAKANPRPRKVITRNILTFLRQGPPQPFEPIICMLISTAGFENTQENRNQVSTTLDRLKNDGRIEQVEPGVKGSAWRYIKDTKASPPPATKIAVAED